MINPYGPTVINDYTSCVSEIIGTEFNNPGLLFFVNTLNMSTSVARIRADLLKSIHNEVKHNVQIASPTHIDEPLCGSESHLDDRKLGGTINFDTLPSADYVVVIIDTYEEYCYATSRLLRARTWNPAALFIILFFHFTASDETNVAFAEKIVDCLFTWNVINIVVIVPQADNVRNALIYGWRPYDPPKYCGYKNETAKGRLLVENVCEHGILKHNKKLFYNRVPEDMMGCTLNIIALQRQPFISNNPKDSNIERQLISEMAKDYNLTTNFVITEKMRGENNEDEGWNGALGDLFSKVGHVAMGGIFPDDDIHKDFECSATYLADSYTWVVPRAYQLPPAISLIIIFKIFVWVCSILIFIVCVVTWRIMGQLSGDSPYHRNIGHCFMNALVSILGFAAYARPKTESLRVFFVFYCLYCILLITAYTTKLIDVLTNPPFEYQIKTMEELLDSGLKFGGFEELHDLFQNSSDPFDYLIGERWEDVEDKHRALKDVVVYRNFSLLCSRLELAHISATLPELSDSAGNYKYYAFESNVFTVPMEMVALRGFPFMYQFSYRLEMYKQIGVNALVRDRFAEHTMRKRSELLKSLSDANYDVRPLSLAHLQGGFYFLMLGYVSGTITLFIEILVNDKSFRDRVANYVKTLRSNKYFKSVFRTKTS